MRKAVFLVAAWSASAAIAGRLLNLEHPGLAKAKAAVAAASRGREWLRVESSGKPIRLPVGVPQPGTCRVEFKLADLLLDEPVAVRTEGGQARQIAKAGKPQGEAPFTGLGAVEVPGGHFTIELTARAVIGIDHLRLTRLEP